MTDNHVRILLVEDNPGDARLLRETLVETLFSRFELIHVEELSEGLQRLQQEHFDLILLDLMLPDEQGFGTFTRTHSQAPRVPIIVLTGLDDETLAFKAVREGAQDYLVKGQFDGNLLVRAMRYATERKCADEALLDSEERHRLLFETMAEGVVFQNIGGEITSANAAAQRILGLTLDQMKGRTSLDPRWRAIHEDGTDFEGDTHPAMVALRTGEPVQDVVMGVFHPQEGAYRWININAIPLFRAGESCPYQVYTTFNDITDRKRAEDRLQASLREKEMLLKEIHHRVKNNLQVIASLLDLQAESIQDPAVLQMFQESRNRVRAMGLVHEQLYRSRDLSRIRAARYVPDLVNHLLSIYGSTAVAIDTCIQIDDVHLGVDTAIPCGLLITELVSNAFKHAFPDLEAGSWDGEEGRQVYVELKADGDEKIRLVVRDNGVGLPPQLDWRRTPSLGLQLVDLLSRQIHGSVELDQTLGTKFTITFTDPAR